MIPIILLSFILIISVYTDVKERRILNIITLPALLLALIYYSITGGLTGTWFSLAGMFVGFGLLFIPFLMGGMGAGDVKLLAAVGAWMGATFALYTFFIGAIVGGVYAVILLIRQRHLKTFLLKLIYTPMLLKNDNGSMTIGKGKDSLSLPYGVVIALGAVAAFIMEAMV